MRSIGQMVYDNQKLEFIVTKNGITVNFYCQHNSNWILNMISQLIWLPDFNYSDKPNIVIEEPSDLVKKIFIKNQETYPFDTIITISCPELPNRWIKFSVSLKSTTNALFKKFGPEIRLKLKPAFKTDEAVHITQPTKHTPITDEWKSNDLPATYFWNPKSGIESFFFMDFSNMSWMDPSTFERFSIYECGYDGEEILGLLHRIPLKSPVVLKEAFTFNYDFYISQEYNEIKPSKWDAVYSLINRCFTLLPGRVPFQRQELHWKTFANGCIKDLMKEDICWSDKNTPLYHAYVMDEAERSRREKFGKRVYFETMTMLDILPPWLVFLEFNKEPEITNHVLKSCKAIKHFIDPKTNILRNRVFFDNGEYKTEKPSKISIGDSWYFFEPIARFGWLVKLLKSEKLKKECLQSFLTMANEAILFSRKHNFQISAFYDPLTLEPLNSTIEGNKDRRELYSQVYGSADLEWKKVAKNYACIAIFSYIMIEAYYFTNDEEYLNESIKAIQVLKSTSPDNLFWEPLEIAYGVASLGELYKITQNEDFLDFGLKLILNELRMFYWYNDNSFGWKGKRNNLGLVMACVGIRYPAMKENLESVYPWTILLKQVVQSTKIGSFPLGILKIFNLIRINSFHYFSNVLPEDLIYPPRRNSPCPFIPFEDLEMLETAPLFSESQESVPRGQRSGTLGREIYGAGEVIWLYLLFECFAKSINNDIMVLNLDLFDFKTPDLDSLKEQNYLAYNPNFKAIWNKITFLQLRKERWAYEIFYLNGNRKKKVKDGIIDPINNRIEIFMKKNALYQIYIEKTESEA